MRANQARTISISEYLQTVEGIQPAHSRMGGRELWYRSPLRQWDSTPSFKVDTVLNLWHDHGIAQWGNTLDLVCALRNASVKEALAVLRHSGLYRGGISERRAPVRSGGQGLFPSAAASGVTPATPSVKTKKEAQWLTQHRILSVEPLAHRALLEYLDSRCIERAVAVEHLKQVEFSPADQLASYFALWWPNGEGFEVRNKYFKGFVGSGKTVSLLNVKPDSDVLLFEGFMDYLSYLTLLRQQRGLHAPEAGVIVLNSTSLRVRALPVLSQAKPARLFCFFDHDEAGRSTLEYFQLALPDSVIVDKSSLYAGFKDFNAWWCAQCRKTPKKDD